MWRTPRKLSRPLPHAISWPRSISSPTIAPSAGGNITCGSARLAGADIPSFEHVATGKNGLNKRCSNARLRRDIGEIFRFPSFEEGLPDAITNAAAFPPP